MKKLTAFLLAGAMIMSFTSCDTDADLGYISPTVTNMGEFDFAQTSREITVGGKSISLPCTVGELGSGFTTSDGEQYDAGTMFKLKYDGKTVGNVRLKCAPDADTSGVEIDFIEFISGCDLELNGISFKSTIDDVKKRFGEPSASEFDCIRYNGGAGYVEFCHSGGNNQRIQFIRMDFKGE